MSGGVTIPQQRDESVAVPDALRRKAMLQVIVQCDQHGCDGPGCTHINHRRDMHYAASMIFTAVD